MTSLHDYAPPLCALSASLPSSRESGLLGTLGAVAGHRARWAAAHGDVCGEASVLATLTSALPPGGGPVSLPPSLLHSSPLRFHACSVTEEVTLASFWGAVLWRRGVGASTVAAWGVAIGPTILQQHKDRLGIPLANNPIAPTAPHHSDTLAAVPGAFTALADAVRRCGGASPDAHTLLFLLPLLNALGRLAADTVSTVLASKAQPGGW